MCLRLNFIVEGQTEERFVNTVLRDHFADQSIVAVAHCVTTRRERRAEHLRHRGGLTTYKHARDDIHRWVQEDSSGNARFTTMFRPVRTAHRLSPLRRRRGSVRPVRARRNSGGGNE